MTIVKTSVIAMAVLIVVGIAGLGYMMSTRLGALQAGSPALNPDRALLVRLGLPAETQIRSVSASENSIALHLAIPNRGLWIYVIPLSGEGRMLKIAISDTGGTAP